MSITQQALQKNPYHEVILYTREEITKIALGIVAESGAESLNARSLAEAMGTSTRPIFTAFRNMEELESAVRESAMKVFGQFAEKETPDMPALSRSAYR